MILAIVILTALVMALAMVVFWLSRGLDRTQRQVKSLAASVAHVTQAQRELAGVVRQGSAQ